MLLRLSANRAFRSTQQPPIARSRRRDDRPSRRRFTLIELLVVVAVIAILAAMLLPALSKARKQAKRLTGANNQRQMAFGLTLYANDNDGCLPGGLQIKQFSGVPHNYYRNPTIAPTLHNKTSSVDLYTPAVEYSYLPSTDSPMVESGAWAKPNTFYMASPHWYFPGFRSAPTAPISTSPLQLANADSHNLMISDLNLDISGTFYGVHMRYGALNRGFNGSPNYNAFVGIRANLQGSYGTFYDMSVIWHHPAEMTYTYQTPGDTTRRIYHPPMTD